jgi:hypothetical protein
MSERVSGALASWSAHGIARCLAFVRCAFEAIRQAHDRKAAREAERLLKLSGQKFTDETERKMMEHLTRNQNFRP